MLYGISCENEKLKPFFHKTYLMENGRLASLSEDEPNYFYTISGKIVEIELILNSNEYSVMYEYIKYLVEFRKCSIHKLRINI